MSTYFIEAADVLFFKDGREVAPGAEYSAASLFPPNPSTLYGALRSALLSMEKETDFQAEGFNLDRTPIGKIVGKKTKTGSLKINQFSLAKKDGNHITPLYPLPFDILSRKKPDYDKGEKDELTIPSLINGKEVGIRNNLPGSFLKNPWFRKPEGSFFEYQSVFINNSLFNSYLKGRTIANDYKKRLENTVLKRIKNGEKVEQDYFCKEPRMGIVIDSDTQTVEDGKLFTTPFIRTNFEKHIGFVADLNIGLDRLPDKTKIRLGGDGKLALLTQGSLDSSNVKDYLKQNLEQNTICKLILTTPAVFDNGWLPDGIDPETGQGEINGIAAQLVGATTGKPLLFGGWDLANKRPKETLKAVPPGSVYNVKITGDVKQFVDKVHKQSICSNPDYNKQGLGITHIGINH